MFARFLKSALVAVAMAGLVACASPEARFTEAMSKGAEYFQAGDLEKARIEFRNALQIKPNDADARFEAGRVAEQLRNLREAVQFYRGALDIRKDHYEAMANLGRILAVAGLGDEALKVIQPGLEARPDDVALLTVRATARSQQGDRGGAREDAERAVELQPSNTMAVAVLSALYKSAGETPKAVELLEKTIALLPREIDLRVALAQVYAAQGDSLKVVTLLRETIRLDPSVSSRRILLARYLSSQGDLDGAERELRAAVTAAPRESEPFAALLDFLRVKRGLPVAERELEARLKGNPDDVRLKFEMAALQEQAGQGAKAEAIYRSVIADDLTSPESLESRGKLTTLLLRRGDVAGAEKLVGEILQQNPRDTTGLQMRGAIALAKGDPHSAIADLRTVLRDQPGSIPLLRTIAQAHLANGEPALAENALQEALDVDPLNVQVRLDAAMLYVNSGRPERARPLLDQLSTERPTDVAILDAAFRTAVALRDVPRARALAIALTEADPKDARGPLYAGMVAESDGRNAVAEKAYRQAVALGPGTKEPLQALARLLSRTGRTAELVSLLDAVALREPSNPFPLLLKGEALTTTGRQSAAADAFRAAIARAPRWWLAYRGLAVAMAAGGDAAGAAKVLRDAVTQVAEPLPLRAELAAMLARNGKPQEAINEYESIHRLNPASLLVTNNLALLIVTYRDDPASLAHALQIAKPLAGSSDAGQRATYAWVLFRSGDASNALPLLESTAGVAPDDPTLQYRLGMAQAALGQRQKARASLQRALRSGVAFEGAEKARAKLRELTRS